MPPFRPDRWYYIERQWKKKIKANKRMRVLKTSLSMAYLGKFAEAIPVLMESILSLWWFFLPLPPTRSNQNYTELLYHFFKIFSDRVALVCINWKTIRISAKHSNNLKISHTQPSSLICILQSKTFYSFNANAQLGDRISYKHLKTYLHLH